MTIGEKIKQVRLDASLTQEQFAEKLCVSRQAISKWESGRGVPDLINLQQLAGLFHVSIDSLLREDALSLDVIREKLDYETITKTGKCQSKYDAAVKSKYPEGEITHIIRFRRLTKWMKVIEFFTVPRIRNVFDYMDDRSWYYLVRSGGRNLFVRVDDAYIETRNYTGAIEKNRLVIGGFDYVLSKHTL